MLRLTVKGILAHRRRLLSTGLAVVLGIAFLCGTFVLGDTIKRSFDNLLATVNSGTDAYIRRSDSIEAGEGSISRRDRGQIDESLLTPVRSIPGVAAADADLLTGGVRILGRDGKVVGGDSRRGPSFGANWRLDQQLNPFKLVAGAPPQAADDVVVDRGSARTGNLHVGDQITVLVPDAQTFHLAGIVTFGDQDSPGGASYALFTLPTAEQYLGARGRIDGIVVRARAGVSQDALTAQLRPALPAGVEAVTGAAIVKETQDAFQQRISGFTKFLSSFGFVAVIVGAFVIYNTFSIIIAQRTREMALLRAVGGSRRQVLAGVLLEALSLAVFASAVGVVGGVGVGAALRALFQAGGFAFPPGGLVLSPRTVVAGFIVGLLVTMLAAVMPAIRASRIAPLEALREAALDVSAASRWRIGVGAVVTAFGLFEIVSGVAGKHATPIGIGAAATLIGMIVLGPVTARPVSRVIGLPLAKFRGVTGSLARENAMRNPRRTAGTGAALMVGVTVVMFFAVIAASLRATTNDQINRSFVGDLAVTPATFGFNAGFSPALTAKLRVLPQVAEAVPLRFGEVELAGATVGVVSTDPAAFAKVVRIDTTAGSLQDLGVDRVAISDTKAETERWHVGDTVTIRYPDTGAKPFTIAAIFKTTDLLDAPIVVSTQADDANTPRPLDRQVLVKLRAGVDFATSRAAIEAAVKAYPTARVQDSHDLKQSYTSRINGFLAIIFGMLALAIVIALIGIGNTLQLSVFERTRELGLLRAVGSTRRQVRSMVRWEATIIAVFGTFGGVMAGVAFGWAIIHGLGRDNNVLFAVPVGQAVVIMIVGAAAGVLAALRPASRAGRLDILAAIAAE